MRGSTTLPLLAVLAACSVAAADHERLGDQAYRGGHFAEALGEYQAAQRSGVRTRVWAKTGSAALKAEDYAAATAAYSALAHDDPSRATEAAIGLERVARAAVRGGGSNLANVRKAVLALRAVSPARPLGSLARAPLEASTDASEALGLLPPAIATAGNTRSVDSLLLRYAEAQRTTVACDEAARTYRTLLRRTDDAGLKATGRSGLADCALLLGQDALTTKDGAAAERWFETVVGFEPETVRGWRAQIGLGDARVLQGDALGAAVAYQAVLSGAGVPDSLRNAATVKLNGLGAASTAPPADGDS